MEDPPKKFFRLSPGKEVRLRCAYFIKCTEVVKDEAGRIVELRCTYDPATRGGDAPDGRRVKATLHWVSARARAPGGGAPLRSPLRRSPIPRTSPEGQTFLDRLNPQSLEVVRDCQGGTEPRLGGCRGAVPVRAPRIFLRRSATRGPTRSSSTAPSRSATPGRRSNGIRHRASRAGSVCTMPIFSRGISHHAVRARAGRARNPIHRGVLRRVSAQEDRDGNRPPAEGPRPPDSARHGAAARRSGNGRCRSPSRSRTRSACRKPNRN